VLQTVRNFIKAFHIDGVLCQMSISANSWISHFVPTRRLKGRFRGAFWRLESFNTFYLWHYSPRPRQMRLRYV